MNHRLELSAARFTKRPQGLFASQFGGLVLEAECQRSSIIAYLTRREEDEIVIDPSDVTVINRVSIAEDGEADDDEGRNVELTTSEHGGSAHLGIITASRIRQFEPKLEWFDRGWGGIHGIAHETRVLIWSQVLSAMAVDAGLSVDAEVLGWAAVIHDTQRWDEGIDPEHGARAADWIESHPDLLPPSVPLNRVAYLCRWHVPPDDSAPEMTDELRVFKDADALDRWRIGDLDPSYVRIASTKRLLTASRSLWTASRDLDRDPEAFSKIMKAAIRSGILHGG